MAIGFESATERIHGLPEHEAAWIDGRVKSISKMLDERDQFPNMLFDGRSYDEQTAHLRLLQYHRDSMRQGFSDIGRQAILDIAVEFGVVTELSDDVVQANWLKAAEDV